VTQEAHDDAKVRMTTAGAKPINWVAVVNEWNPDYTTPERAALVGVFLQHGGAAALLTDYGMAQVKAGAVQVPNGMRRGAGSAR
jgi:hypothetical protein